jgi:hypothetical protein
MSGTNENKPKRRDEIGFIPYKIETPAHWRGFPETSCLREGAGTGWRLSWSSLLLSRSR